MPPDPSELPAARCRRVVDVCEDVQHYPEPSFLHGYLEAGPRLQDLCSAMDVVWGSTSGSSQVDVLAVHVEDHHSGAVFN